MIRGQEDDSRWRGFTELIRRPTTGSSFLTAGSVVKEEERSELDLCLNGGWAASSNSARGVIDRLRGRDRRGVVEVVHRELRGERKDAIRDRSSLRRSALLAGTFAQQLLDHRLLRFS